MQSIGTLLIFSICKIDAMLWLWDNICQKQKEQIILQRKCFREPGDAYSCYPFLKSDRILKLWEHSCQNYVVTKLTIDADSSETVFKISCNLELYMICFKSWEDIIKLLWQFFCCLKWNPWPYLIFVISFTQAFCSVEIFYTQNALFVTKLNSRQKRVNRSNTLCKIMHCGKIPIHCVKSPIQCKSHAVGKTAH